MYCATPDKLLFNGPSKKDIEKWKVLNRTLRLDGMEALLMLAGWKYMPRVYLVCENDQCIPQPLQEKLAAAAGSKVERYAGGHIVMLRMPDKVVEVVKSAAA